MEKSPHVLLISIGADVSVFRLGFALQGDEPDQ
jgi:hypothetical protein